MWLRILRRNNGNGNRCRWRWYLQHKWRSDQSKFSIDGSSGALTFSSAPDYENPTDVGTNNTYVVEVTASDGSLTDAMTTTATATDVNEAPSITSSNSANVAENTTSVITTKRCRWRWYYLQHKWRSRSVKV